MGLVHAKLILKNPRNTKIKPVEVEALVDSGALHLRIPEHLRIQLKAVMLRYRLQVKIRRSDDKAA